MSVLELAAETREAGGKGAARKLRAAGSIPGIVYGPGGEPTAISLSPKALTAALKTPHRRNAVIKVQVGDKTELVMVKDLEVHPVTEAILHVDFYRVSADRPVQVKVPVLTQGRAVGVQRGGGMRKMRRDIPVRVNPLKIPEAVHCDVSNLDLGGTFAVSDLSLDAEVEVLLDAKTKLVQITAKELRRAASATENEEAAA